MQVLFSPDSLSRWVTPQAQIGEGEGRRGGSELGMHNGRGARTGIRIS